MSHQGAELPPHVLVFPFPAQGHVNSMLKLAEILCLAGLHVTFLVTHYTHGRLLRHSNVQHRFTQYYGFRFKTISDGLPEEHLRSGDKLMELYYSLRAKTKPLFRELLISNSTPRPVTCVIADGILSFAIDVAEEVGIPIFYFRTISACCFWAYFCIPKLIDAGELPFKGNDLDVPISNVSGMEGFLRQRDLPSFCRAGELADEDLQMVINETGQSPRARALILNTFEELEGPILCRIRSHCPRLYTIGPLHAHLKARLVAKTTSPPTSSNSLWEEDKSCMTWLDSQPLKSVIYASFGSITVMTRDQLMEFWHGLVNSGQRFLWVIRPDSIAGKDWESQIPAELFQGTKERGYMVGWAPQEEVLAHRAIGGFLTHSGWNSTLESIVAGVPMICWPYFADQQVNSRFVGEVWKLGSDMKDTCDSFMVERMVRDLMEVRKNEFVQTADRTAELARDAVSEGGTSYCSLDRQIKDIRSISMQSPR